MASHRQRWVTPAFIVQIAPRPAQDGQKGVGYTTSKKMVGIAVERNRARRRLREIARAVMTANAIPNHDYVLIAKAEALTRPFDQMKKDMTWALKRLKAWSEDGA